MYITCINVQFYKKPSNNDKKNKKNIPVNFSFIYLFLQRNGNWTDTSTVLKAE